MQPRDRRLLVCASEELVEKNYVGLALQYRNESHSGLVFRFKGKVYAYLNQCVHMPRALDCQRDTIFDDARQLLRCSMHGIVYEPETGKSLSTMCNGERLQALRVKEIDGNIYIDDKRVLPAQGR